MDQFSGGLACHCLHCCPSATAVRLLDGLGLGDSLGGSVAVATASTVEVSETGPACGGLGGSDCVIATAAAAPPPARTTTAATISGIRPRPRSRLRRGAGIAEVGA